MKQLKILEPRHLVGSNGDTVNMDNVIRYMEIIGVKLTLVPVVHGDTPDGLRQCKHCTELKNVTEFGFTRTRKGQSNDRYTPICRQCRQTYRINWNTGMGAPNTAMRSRMPNGQGKRRSGGTR